MLGSPDRLWTAGGPKHAPDFIKKNHPRSLLAFNMPHRTAKQIHKAILDAGKILLIPHEDPDGDALGSVSAFAYFLDKINKSYSIFCSTEVPEKLNVLPHLVSVSTDESVWDGGHDLILILDSGDLKYAGVQNQINQLTHNPTIINIDHHPTNENFGHHNLIITTASSTAEILYHFFRYNKIEIDKNMAVSLLTGIVTDTDNFSNPGTTSSSLAVASDLISHGANFNLIKNWFSKDKSIIALKLWGEALSRLTKNEKLDIVYTYLTQKDLKKHNAGEAESQGISNFLNNLSDGRAALLLKETEKGKIKGSMRTTRDDYDVSVIAKSLGGGGHKKAAGFTVEGTIDSVLPKVWQALEKKQKNK